LLLPHLSFDQLKTVVRLSDGRLALDPIMAIAGGGNLKETLVLETSPALTIAFAELFVKSFDLAVIAKAPDVEEIIGRTDLDFNLPGRGRSIAGVMGSLNGDAVHSGQYTRMNWATARFAGTSAPKDCCPQ
jgi:uncharacterized protein involved in outer membrane biogenesis